MSRFIPGHRTTGRIGVLSRGTKILFPDLFEVTRDLIGIVDTSGYLIRVNPAWEPCLGFRPEAIRGRSFFDLIHPEDRDETWDIWLGSRSWQGSRTFETRLITRDGSERYLLWDGIHTPRSRYILIHGQDRTDHILTVEALRRQAELEIRDTKDTLARVSLLDPLTGLPNRRFLFDKIEEAIRSNRRHAEGFGLLFLDLDGFKEINDTLGHSAGDSVLLSAANRIRDGARNADAVTRFGGDEFVILLQGISDYPALQTAARRIERRLGAPLAMRTRDSTTLLEKGLPVSWGWSLFPEDGTGAEALLRTADTRMYAAKRERSRKP
jgi:diguanylate cyclase (GGDEF)-like protein/PAS domain S-box-containing protein